MPRPVRIASWPRVGVALLAAVLLALAALASFGGVEAQTPAPSFLRDAFTYTLDEGADGSGTPIAIGAPIVVADASDTTACAISAQTVTGGSALSPALFAIDPSTCAITYTGSGETRADGTRESFSLTVGVDGNDAGTAADDTIAVTVKIVNAATDKAALEAFYDALGGGDWTVNTNWKSATLPVDCGDDNRASDCWFAVDTDASGRVTEMNFVTLLDDFIYSGNNMVGNLPAALGDLSKLTILDLGFLNDPNVIKLSQISGPIPPEISNLTALTTLNFQHGYLSGPIPPEINHMVALEHLTLGGNLLTGSIPDLRALTALRTLVLAINRLSGGIPAWVNQLTMLTNLQLQQNELSGMVPDLSSLTELRLLALRANRLSGPLPDLSALSSLQALALDHNQFTGPIPDLSHMDSLGTLDLGGNQLSGRIPETLGDMAHLQGLELNDNRLAGPIPDLSGLTDTLTFLDLSRNRLTGGIPDWLGMARLTHLNLSGNRLTGGIPDWLGMVRLTHLNLSDNALSGRVPQSLTALTRLRHLRLEGNALRCVGDSDGDAALLRWFAAVRARAVHPLNVVRVPLCPPVIPYATVTLGVAEEGDVPEGASYGLLLSCGTSSFAPTLAAGETYTGSFVADSSCSLTVTDVAGAAEVRGEFADRPFGVGIYAVTITLVHAAPEPEPREQLESALVAGAASARWPGAETPVADAVVGLSLRVTAVYWWDAAAQAWRSWFPDGDDVGVNTLAAFEPDGIYTIFAEERDGG